MSRLRLQDTVHTDEHAARSRWPWVVLLVLSGLVAASVLYIVVVPVDAEDFESTTGVPWEEFAASTPEVADYLAREARLVAVGYLGLALLAGVTAWSGLCTGNRWAARALWFLPVTLGLTSVVFLASGGVTLGVSYGAVTVIAAGALVGARRNLRGGPP